MSKEWGDRWGADSDSIGEDRRHRRFMSIWDENGNLKVKDKKPMYISDGTRAVKLTEALTTNLKTRILLGMTVIKVPKQTMYYTAQLKEIEYVDSINIGGSVLRARAVKPFKGVWEFRVVTR